ncbi:MAG: alpha/beta hydrolase, partial [Planctomycetaceae bacterium]
MPSRPWFLFHCRAAALGLLAALLCSSVAFGQQLDDQKIDPADPITSDPLFQQSNVTFEDLQTALADPARRDDVIGRHFSRATELTDLQRREILESALESSSGKARQQAVEQLEQLGWLPEFVSDQVAAAGFEAEQAFNSAFITEPMEPTRSPELRSSESIRSLILELKSDSARRRFAAESQLDALGAAAIPGLLDLLADSDLAALAAGVLGRIIAAGELPEVAALTIEPDMSIAGPPPKALPDEPPVPETAHVEIVRETVESQQPTQVRVHFGTNRELREHVEPSVIHLRNGGVFLSIAVLGGWSGFLLRRRRQLDPAPPKIGCSFVVVAGLLVLSAVWGLMQINAGWRERYSQHQGAQFGGRRAPADQIRYGFCDVSIPPTHQVGAVERPLLGAEDVQEHVVLSRTELQEDRAFFEAVAQRLKTAEVSQCFVFVHGYNVTFDDAARRTAQIHYDLKFEGVPLFFSWPSRGGFRHYFSDRNEILVSRQAIRQFLSDVTNRTTAEKIHVIAHSMGADAVCQAIAELDSDGQVFEQVILAAPDIDAEVFEFQLLP